MMHLHITRHGQVLPATEDTWSRADYPPGDPPLSDLGMEQARRLGERLRAQGFSGPVYVSPYLRTVQTACRIADVADLTVEPVALLREIVNRAGQMAEFTGMNAGQLRALHKRVQPAADFDISPWWTSHIESDEDVEARVAPLVDAVIAAGADALLVGHGASTCNAIHHLWRRCAPERIGEHAPGWNCGLTTFRCGTQVEMLRHLDTEHLPDDAVTSNAKSRAQVLAES